MFRKPAAACHEFGAEISEMGDRAAERDQAEPQENPQHLEPVAARRFRDRRLVLGHSASPIRFHPSPDSKAMIPRIKGHDRCREPAVNDGDNSGERRG